MEQTNQTLFELTEKQMKELEIMKTDKDNMKLEKELFEAKYHREMTRGMRNE